ncbi:MAG: NosD domain-containing protein, partial [Candidatus Pacebacteria bacterium]|nr:NosD domain-containing protein [Candidatus Paceibacterota bacterium]
MKKFKLKLFSKSFTLIELLIVITIIVILTAVIFALTSGARAQARDNQRIKQLKELKNVLETYYFYYKEYPSSPVSQCIEQSPSPLQILVDKNYLPKIPQDPRYNPQNPSDFCYIYVTDLTAQHFKLFARMEALKDLAKNDGGVYDDYYEIYSSTSLGAMLTFSGSVEIPGSPQEEVEISSCMEITLPGTYLLTQDIENTDNSACMRIRTSDVILDCQGHKIDGTGKDESYGIIAQSFGSETLINITIQNCLVSDWKWGVYFRNIEESKIVGNKTIPLASQEGISKNTYGIYLNSVEDSIVSNNKISSNYVGIYLKYSGSNVIYNNLFNQEKNYHLDTPTDTNYWNTIKAFQENILGEEYIGGNAWLNSTGTDISQTCEDNNLDSICDEEFKLNDNNIDHFPLVYHKYEEISSCIEITKSGFYRLNTDLINVSNCIRIKSPDVVFDCRDSITGEKHIIDGTGSSGSGIEVGGYTGEPPEEEFINASNFKIKNCIIKEFSNGIYVNQASNGQILNNEIKNNSQYGVQLYQNSDS